MTTRLTSAQSELLVLLESGAEAPMDRLALGRALYAVTSELFDAIIDGRGTSGEA